MRLYPRGPAVRGKSTFPGSTSTDITSLPSFFWDKIGEQKHDIFCRFLTFCKFAPGNLVEWAFDVVENQQSITSQFHQKWPV